jgi:hypothetical protein
LRELWNGWKESVDEFEGVLGKMEEMSSERWSLKWEIFV